VGDTKVEPETNPVEDSTQEQEQEPVESTEPTKPDTSSENPSEPDEELNSTSDKKDLFEEAQATNKQLKQQLEELKNSNTNVFEENAVLKAELEEQQKLVEIAKENAEMKQQLEGIKRNSIIDSLIASGGLTNDLKDWAQSLSFEQLEIFNKYAPKVKTILQQTNDHVSDAEKNMQEWKKAQSKSRIIAT